MVGYQISHSRMIFKGFVINVLILLMINFGQATEIESRLCAIATAHPLATKSGCKILENGGNAFDAAVAVTATLAVVEPFSSGIGGGGFYLLHREKDDFQVFIDARERAPSNSYPQFFIDQNGETIDSLSINGPTAAAIPGIPAALDWLANHYGNLSLKESLSPAIEIASSGFLVDARYIKATEYRHKTINLFAETSSIFLENKKPVPPGFILRQVNLSNTLNSIARQGRDGFYQGGIAKELLQSVNTSGGFWVPGDLEQYQVVERVPVYLDFKGVQITLAPLPSSGGLVITQVLNIMEEYPLEILNNYDGQHLLVEAMRRGYNDRAIYMGDPDFVEVPVLKLLSKKYARNRGSNIDLLKATQSSSLPSVMNMSQEGSETTHFSIMDDFGNRVSATLSINGIFGSGFVAGNTGVLLNNHMNDFSLAPNTPNIYGLIGGKTNFIEPGKRPLSSMSPTFVEDERGILVIGTPGGSRIISMVILGILEYLKEVKPSIENIVTRPRLHHQYLPDRIQIEPDGFDEKWIQAMESRGHKVVVSDRKWGNMQAIFFNKLTRSYVVGNDPRGVE